MIDLEKDVERALRDTVKRHGGLCLKWVCPGWAGVPDRIILLPGGRIIFAEIKRPKGGRISKLQEYVHRKLRGMGFTCLIIWSKTDVAKLEEVVL